MAAGDVEVSIISPLAKTGASFDGIDDEINCGSNMFFGTNDFSMSAWIKPADVSGQQAIMGALTGTGTDGFTMKLLNAKFVGRIIDNSIGSIDTLEAGTDVVALNWSFVTVVFDRDGYMKTYVNGVFNTQADISSLVAASINPAIDFFIGRRDNAGTPQWFAGIISDAKVFNKALTQTDITNLYIGNVSEVSGLIHHWPLLNDFNDAVGSFDGTESGCYLGIFDEDIAASIKAARTTANDIFLLVDTGHGKQVISTVIEEAP